MSDLIAALYPHDLLPVPAQPPTPSPAHIQWTRWPWGWLGLGERLWRCVDGADIDGSRFFAAGRPAKRGAASLANDQIPSALGGDSDAYEMISGKFLLLRVDPDGLAVATDRFSQVPVYLNTKRREDEVLVVASNVEWISDLTDRVPEFDPVSIAELLLWDNITFPHTTRSDISQLAPGSLHRLRVSERGQVELNSQVLWQPREPDSWPSKRECIEAAAIGVEEAAAEISASASHVGVLLSGGLDSRIVASSLSKLAQVEAVTYADRPNRESDSAARTASTLGIPHHLIERDPEFYAHAFVAGQRLAGFEQNSIPCHALCIVDDERVKALDVIVGGFGCDILLKGAYIPYGMTDVLRAWYGLGALRPSDRIGKHNYSHTKVRIPMVKPDLVQAAQERRAAYENSLRTFRPRTAEEWIGFYPISHTTSIDSRVSDRCLQHDEFYLHAGIVDASVMTPWVWKKGLQVISSLGKRYAPAVASLPHPDTGLPATWTYYPSRFAPRCLRRRSSSPALPKEAPVWFSDGSFVNYSKFFEHAPAWQELRKDAMRHSEAIAVLSEVMTVDVSSTFGRYFAPDSLLNAMIVQLIRLIDRGAISAPSRVVGDRS